MSAIYYPSYFESYIPTIIPLTNLATLPQNEKALCYHEYIHYIQNISTTFGILRTWHNYDLARQLIFYVQQQANPISLPLSGPIVAEQYKINCFLKIASGDIKLISSGPEHGYEITDLVYADDPSISKVIPGLRGKKVKLIVSQAGYTDEIYHFGGEAISEFMAHTLENKFFGNPPHSHYPYLVVEKVANFIFPEILKKLDLLLMLCDMSLMYPLPGWAFCYILNRIKRQNQLPKHPVDLSNFAYTLFDLLGWDVNPQLRHATRGLLGVINSLYNHGHFNITKRWFETIITRGTGLRLRNPDFINTLYTDTQAMGPNMAPLFETLGGPQFKIDPDPKIQLPQIRFLKEPAGMQAAVRRIHPQHLRASGIISSFLLTAQISPACNLYGTCSTSIPNLTDHRCFTAPWKRANDIDKCPFGAAWFLYGFHQKELTINGIPIK